MKEIRIIEKVSVASVMIVLFGFFPSLLLNSGLDITKRIKCMKLHRSSRRDNQRSKEWWPDEKTANVYVFTFSHNNYIVFCGDGRRIHPEEKSLT